MSWALGCSQVLQVGIGPRQLELDLTSKGHGCGSHSHKSPCSTARSSHKGPRADAFANDVGLVMLPRVGDERAERLRKWTTTSRIFPSACRWWNNTQQAARLQDQHGSITAMRRHFHCVCGRPLEPERNLRHMMPPWHSGCKGRAKSGGRSSGKPAKAPPLLPAWQQQVRKDTASSCSQTSCAPRFRESQQPFNQSAFPARRVVPRRKLRLATIAFSAQTTPKGFAGAASGAGAWQWTSGMQEGGREWQSGDCRTHLTSSSSGPMPGRSSSCTSPQR